MVQIVTSYRPLSTPPKKTTFEHPRSALSYRVTIEQPLSPPNCLACSSFSGARISNVPGLEENERGNAALACRRLARISHLVGLRLQFNCSFRVNIQHIRTHTLLVIHQERKGRRWGWEYSAAAKQRKHNEEKRAWDRRSRKPRQFPVCKSDTRKSSRGWAKN